MEIHGESVLRQSFVSPQSEVTAYILWYQDDPSEQPD
jgi:hypothetical protein